MILENQQGYYDYCGRGWLLLENSTELSEEFMGKLNKFLDEELSVEDILDHILEVGMENISVFERYYLDNNNEFRKKE